MINFFLKTCSSYTSALILVCLCSVVFITSEKQLCLLQFSAHETLHVVVNVGQINMTNIIIMTHFN